MYDIPLQEEKDGRTRKIKEKREKSRELDLGRKRNEKREKLREVIQERTKTRNEGKGKKEPKNREHKRKEKNESLLRFVSFVVRDPNFKT